MKDKDETKKKHFTAYRSPSVDRILKHRPDSSLAGRMGEVCERYWHIILSCMPQLNDDEMKRLGDFLPNLPIDSLAVDYLHNELASHAETSDIAEKIKSFTTAERYALLERLKH